VVLALVLFKQDTLLPSNNTFRLSLEAITLALSKKAMSDNVDLPTLSKLLGGLGALGHQPERTMPLSAICRCIERRVSELRVCDTVRLVYGLALLHYVPEPGFLLAIARHTGHNELRQMDTMAGARFLWGFAVLGGSASEEGGALVVSLSDILGSDLSALDAEHLGLVANGLATAKMPAEGTFQGIAVEAERKLVELKPLDVSRLLRALASMSVRPEASILESLGECVLKDFERYRPVELADVMCGYGQMVHAPPEGLLAEFGKALQNRLKDFCLDDLTRLLWGLARVRYAPPNLVACFAYAVDKIVVQAAKGEGPKVPAHTMAQILWGFGAMDKFRVMGALMGTISDYIKEEKILGLLAPPELADVAWSWAAMRYLPDHRLLDILASECIAKMFKTGPRELSTIIWSFAVLSSCPRRWLETAIKETERKLDEFTPTELSTAIWGLTVLSELPNTAATCAFHHTVAFRGIFEKLTSVPLSELCDYCLHAIHEVFLLLDRTEDDHDLRAGFRGGAAGCQALCVTMGTAEAISLREEAKRSVLRRMGRRSSRRSGTVAGPRTDPASVVRIAGGEWEGVDGTLKRNTLVVDDTKALRVSVGKTLIKMCVKHSTCVEGKDPSLLMDFVIEKESGLGTVVPLHSLSVLNSLE